MKLAVACVVICGSSLLTGCGQPLSQRTGLAHVVLYDFRPDAPPDAREALCADAQALLSGLPTVRGIWLGTPADTKTTGRPMVHDDYDLGLVVLFDDLDGLNEYLEYPDHVTFARRHDPRCNLRVFDVVSPARSAERSRHAH